MGISKTQFEGQPAIELTTGAMRLVAVTGYGPRIAFIGARNGPNMLLWEP